MNDVKLHDRNYSGIKDLLKILKYFIDDIGVYFGLDKFTKAIILHVSPKQTSSIILDRGVSIKDLEQKEACKYFTVNEKQGLHYKHEIIFIGEHVYNHHIWWWNVF